MNLLETDRLIICQLSTADAPFILTLLNTPSWLQFIGDKDVKNLADAERYIVNGPMVSYNQYGHGLYLTKLKEGNIPIGICGLIKRDTLDDIDIGFAFLPEYTGKGFAFEAASAVMRYGKEVLGLPRIVAITTTENIHSIKLLERLGLTFRNTIKLGQNAEAMLFFSTNP